MSDEDNSWVFDSLVCFLNGPIWNAPLQSFIEEKSLIFEPSDTENEEYKKIFDEFKNLVDFMLGNFMEDIGITPAQFEEACTEGKKYQVSFDHNLFEQIWAANDFEMFVRMMTQRNVELQLQALELIEKKYGITPQSFVPKKNNEIESKVKEIPVIVEKESMLEKEILEEVAKKFPEEEPSTSTRDLENLIEHKPILQQKLKETIEKAQILPEKKEQDPAHKDKNETSNEDTKPDINLNKPKEVNALELKKRQDYLRAQRDKLVALKKEVRQKQLTTESGSKNKSPRPKSAKGAEKVMSGEKPNTDAGQLQIRKTLAERLKAEVVGKEQK